MLLIVLGAASSTTLFGDNNEPINVGANAEINRAVVDTDEHSIALNNGWICSASTDGFCGSTGLGRFDAGGSLSNVDEIHGIRHIEVILNSGFVAPSSGLAFSDGEIEFTRVQTPSPNINYVFEAYHPDYFRLEFTSTSVESSLSISYSSICTSEVYKIGICF